MAPIKLYVGGSYREEGVSYSPLMYPFWGVIAKDTMPYVASAARQYHYRSEDFTLAKNIQEADFVFIPHNFWFLKRKNPAKVETIIREARAAGKPLLIDGTGDIEHPISIPNSVVLRLSQYRYAVQDNEITVPFFAEDLLESYFEGVPIVRQKSERPSVSFTGWARLSLKQRMRTWIKELPITLASVVDARRVAEHRGVLWREKAIQKIVADNRIDAHIIVRKSYSGHTDTLRGSVADNRKAFVDNLAGADYALTVRGDANAAYRLYEALSLGRIPLVVDTACVLPLEDIIDYRAFCVFVDCRELNNIGSILSEFHKKCTPEQFVDMQKKARDAFVHCLRADAFSAQLAAQLHKRIQPAV